MEADRFTCPVCHNDFDLSERLPKIIPVCGHSFCSICLEKLPSIQGNKLQCPLDKQISERWLKYPVNFSLRQLIEDRIKMRFCQEHNKEVTLICIEENKKICTYCLEDHQEKGHKFQSIGKLQDKATFQKHQISNLLDDIKNYRDKSLKILEESKMTMIQKIKERFNEIRKLVDKKEKELIFETDSLINLEKAQIEILLGKKSGLVEEASKRHSDLIKILEDQEFPLNKEYFSEIEEYIQKWKIKMDSKEEHIKIKEGFDKMNELFDSCFKEKEIFGYELDMPLLDPLEAFIYTFSEDENKETILWNPEVGVSYFETFSLLDLQNCDGYLKIISGPKEVLCDYEAQKINLGNLDNLTKIEIILRQIITGKDLEILNYIWKKIKGNVHFYLNITSGVATEDLYRILKGGSISFSQVEIDLTDYEKGENDFSIPLIENIFSKAKDLQTLSIYMRAATYTPGDLVPLFNKMKDLEITNLENFTLNLANTSVSDREISQVFFTMPNVRKYSLFLTETEITDKSLELFAKNTLSSAPFLKDFTLHIEETQVTDYGMEYLLKALQNMNMEKLDFDLNRTQITDKSLDLLSLNLTNSLNCFEIDLRESIISKDSLFKIFKPLENLKSFYLRLTGENINDKVLENFAKNALVSMKLLEDLTLIFSETDVSDIGVVELIKHLPENLVNIHLDFSLPTYLNLKKDDDGLLTITSDPNANEQISLNNLDNLDNLTKTEIILRQIITGKDLEILNYIWKKIKGTVHFYLNITSGVATEDLYRILKGGSISFSQVVIDLINYEKGENDFSIPLIENIFSKAKDLQTLSIYMRAATYTPGDLVPLFNKMKDLEITNLESFILDLGDTSVSDQEISQVFFAMPNLRKYSLFLSETEISEKTLELCTKNTLSSAPFLKDFQLYLHGTQVTDYGMEYLLKTLQKHEYGKTRLHISSNSNHR